MEMSSKKSSILVLTSANHLLDLFSKYDDFPRGIPPIKDIISDLKISRTTFNSIIEILSAKGIVKVDGSNKIILHKPKKVDYFDLKEIDTNNKANFIEKKIIQKLSSYELKPGVRFSELEIANELNISTVLTREALLKISHSGIIIKNPGQKWEVVEFSHKLINEIHEVRLLFEKYAMSRFKAMPKTDPLFTDLKVLRERHIKLLSTKKIKTDEMRNLEADFHNTLIKSTDNTFIVKSYESIFTLITFHLWQIKNDDQKNRTVLSHHLKIIDFLLAEKFKEASALLVSHLEYAKNSMRNVNLVLTKK